MAGREELSSDSVSRFWTKISLVAEIAAVFRNSPPEKSIYSRALELIRKVVEFESAALYLFNKNKKSLDEIIVLGDKIEPAAFDAYHSGQDFLTWVIKQRKPILSSNTKDKNRSTRLHNESALMIPLVVGNYLIGILFFARDKDASFIEKDIKLLTIIGDQIALSIERSIYQKELEKKNSALQRAKRELKEAQERLIDAGKLMAVRELAVSVNHAINNPLSVITGNVEYLLYVNKGLDQKVVKRLDVIASEALRIAEYNRRLLEIQTLVTESYLKDDCKVLMIDLHKPSEGIRSA